MICPPPLVGPCRDPRDLEAIVVRRLRLPAEASALLSVCAAQLGLGRFEEAAAAAKRARMLFGEQERSRSAGRRAPRGMRAEEEGPG